MSLTESADHGVTGCVRDDAARGGQPERGRIVGRRRGAAVAFVKTMPVGYVSEADGTMEEIGAWQRRTQGVEVPDLPPHRIHYAGELAVDGTLAGSWVIRVAGGGGDGGCIGGEGTWTARRVADVPSAV
ncbi:MAG: hypothetical protein KF830_00135 [Planctomycetes bacterium]|nr:hypothetical protein [Planctomycetota bacterium]